MSKNSNITIMDVWTVVNRLEDKLDERLIKIEIKQERYDSFQNKMMGISAIISLFIATISTWLWKKIKEEDLKDNDGKYWSVAGDLSFMFPMFEMSGEKHYKHIPNTTYIYNENNPLNDHKVNMSMVNSIVNIIRNKTPYERIN